MLLLPPPNTSTTFSNVGSTPLALRPSAAAWTVSLLAILFDIFSAHAFRLLSLLLPLQCRQSSYSSYGSSNSMLSAADRHLVGDERGIGLLVVGFGVIFQTTQKQKTLTPNLG